MWIILPGLACAPQDYEALRRHLNAVVLDAWEVGLDAPIESVRAAVLRHIQGTQQHVCAAESGGQRNSSQLSPAISSADATSPGLPTAAVANVSAHKPSIPAAASMRAGVSAARFSSGQRPSTADKSYAQQETPSQSPEPLQIFGHSMGGLLAIEWALHYPQEVTRIVLADPTVPDNATPWPFPQWLIRASAYALAPALPMWRKAMNLWGTRSPEPLTPQQLRHYYAGVPATQTLLRQSIACETMQQRVERRLNAQLSAYPGQRPIHAPITHLVAADEASRSAFVRQQRVAAARLGSQLHFLPGHGHLFPISAAYAVKPFL